MKQRFCCNFKFGKLNLREKKKDKDTSKNFSFKCLATTSRAADVGMLLQIASRHVKQSNNWYSKEDMSEKMNIIWINYWDQTIEDKQEAQNIRKLQNKINANITHY